MRPQNSLRHGGQNEVLDPLQERNPAMHPALRLFIRQYLGVVGATLVPVVLTTFLSVPMNLGGHPGEIRSTTAMMDRHMT